jgi:hypothetical protein
VVVAWSISVLCCDFYMPYELPIMIMAILYNFFVVDPYFIRWFMRCEYLSCSWCMSRCILLSHSLLLVLIKHVCESMRWGWCVLDGVTL